MPCILSSGKSLACRDYQGGIKAVYIGAYNGSTLTYGMTSSSTGSNMINSFTAGTSSYYTHEQELEIGSYKETQELSIENGTVVINQELTLTFYPLDEELKNRLSALARNNWRIIYQDNNGYYYMMGLKNGCRMTGGEFSVGKALADLHGATITFTSKEPLSSTKLTTAAALQLITA
ncbi:MAG: hypothetical protein EOO89_28405 [Pedobacter sp.]|nr:MAG: hypothetical protein EOO89_28405 [Pedobacter sp.]